MIHQLPARSRSAFVTMKGEIRNLMAMLKAPRPLSPAIIMHELDDILGLVDDVETDVLADVAELAELAERWDLDDQVVLGPKQREAVRS